MSRRLPEVLTRNQARALFKSHRRYFPNGKRDFCIIKLMLNASLRASEVLNLAWRNLDLDTSRLIVRQEKGKKDR